MLDVVLADANAEEIRQQLTVCVIDSQPVIVNGDLCYRIRLQNSERDPILFEQQVRRG